MAVCRERVVVGIIGSVKDKMFRVPRSLLHKKRRSQRLKKCSRENIYLLEPFFHTNIIFKLHLFP